MKVRLTQIFVTFAKVGVCTFGGGYAMLPLLRSEVVAHRGWATEKDITDYYALSQCSPGLIAVNVAVYVTYPLRGIAGAVAASLGVIAPSVAIILLLATLLQSFAHLPLVEHAFAGIRVAVAALVLHAVYKLYKSGVGDLPAIGVFAVTLALGMMNIINPVLVIVGAGLWGVAVQALRRKAPGGSL